MMLCVTVWLSHMSKSMVKVWYLSQLQITQLYNTEKVIEDSKVDNIIQYISLMESTWTLE